jgi:hypothetical protein
MANKKSINNKIAAADFCIKNLVDLRKRMLDEKNNKTAPIGIAGGIVFALNSALLLQLDEIFTASVKSENPDAKKDMEQFKLSFCKFIDDMVSDGLKPIKPEE